MKKIYVAGVLAVLLTASPAMAINFSQSLKNVDGSLPKSDKGEPIPTLGAICTTALISTYRDEQDLNTGKETITPEEKYHRGRLASKIADAGDKDLVLPPEDVALLKKLVGKAYGPLIVYQALRMLDPSLSDGVKP